MTTPRPLDIVTILWKRNPLRPLSPRTIEEATVLGSPGSCPLLAGIRYRDAAMCLLSIKFVEVSNTNCFFTGVSVFVRPL